MNVSDFEDPLGDENFLYYTSLMMGSNDWLRETDRPLDDRLAEIQLQFNRLGATTPPLPTAPARAPLQPLSHTRMPINRDLVLPPGHLRPAVSPDEMVIRQRGRRRLPVTWSPDMDLKSFSSRSADRTPPKIAPGHLSPQKVDVNLRSTPRKRLTFKERVPLSPDKIDFSDMSTPEKFKFNSPVNGMPPAKRPKIKKF